MNWVEKLISKPQSKSNDCEISFHISMHDYESL